MMRHGREFQLPTNTSVGHCRERGAFFEMLSGAPEAMSLHRCQIAQRRKAAKRYSRIESERRQSLGLDSRPDEGARVATARAR
jgi:hypothetical protein